MTQHKHTQPSASVVLASPAPLHSPAEEVAPTLDDEQRDLDDLCERYVAWRNTRRYFAPPPSSGSVLGQLSGTTGGGPRPAPGGPDATVSPQLAAFHLAYCCQPQDTGRGAFDAYYLHRVRPIKRAADALGISRPSFYRLLSDFRLRVSLAAKNIEAENLAAACALPHSNR